VSTRAPQTRATADAGFDIGLAGARIAASTCGYWELRAPADAHENVRADSSERFRRARTSKRDWIFRDSASIERARTGFLDRSIASNGV
jgi:hypothetical protein